ncbi:hypothetical protein ACFTXJ_14865 [Streptomyces zhihengii]|uniref:hypothetical protein n=1 Tax=Streptomyces zhihengii TaxID=1818004 RepID=UPI00363AAA02
MGALKGRTEAANEFARWLRRITSGVTVRSLETHFPYAKSSWSGFRDGSRLPAEELVKQIAERYLPEPMMRKRQLAEGLRLLAAARQAASALENDRDLPVTMPGPRHADPMTAAFLRLDDARLRQIEAMQKLAASEKRREQLEDMVSVLQERCTLLESERDRAREDAQAELQRELQMSLEYRRQADEKLAHARRAEEKAFALRLAAEEQVAVERMALRNIEAPLAEAADEDPGLSAAHELHLPPLDQIHELLEAAQEQLEDQDDELADLDEQINLGARQADGAEPPRSRIVQGRVLDDGGAGADGVVPPGWADNADNAVTSDDCAAPPLTEDPGGLSEERPATLVGATATSAELVTGLEMASTPAALSTALSQLLQRAGLQSIKTLTEDAFPGRLKDDLVLMTVMRWIDGGVLPDTWKHLESLVRAMGATEREIAAFREAYMRVVGSHPAALDSTRDLSDLSAARRRPALAQARKGVRAREWAFATLGPLVIAVLATGYGAALQAEPRPSPGKLVGYGALGLLICVFVTLASFSLATSPMQRRGLPPGRRPADVGLALSAAALVAGTAAPWLLDTGGVGQSLAQLFGLL